MSVPTRAICAPEAVWEDADEDVEGLLDEWLVAVGDAVERGQVIASLMIVKTSFDLEAPTAGTIAEILIAKGETFGRGTELVTLAAA
jgi:pyruvate/2-oxoglutarate dehydrogenase complex dihydrolipoamide acyltransferase (E2) component